MAVPETESEILGLLISNSESKAPAAGAQTPPKTDSVPTEMSAKEYRQTQDEVNAAAELINHGRDEPLITDEDRASALDAIVDGSKTLASVQSDWRKKIANDPNRQAVTITRSAEDSFVKSATNALLARMGYKPDGDVPSDMESMKFFDMAKRCASFTGLRLVGSDEDQAKQLLQINPMDMPMSAESYNRPGDFPNLLSNLANKVLDGAIELAKPTYPLWTNRMMDLPNFLPKTVLGVGSFDNLPEIADDEDPPQLKFSEELKGFIQSGQHAAKVGMTPVMMVNDDLDGFEQQLRSLMMAHEFKLNSLCVAILIANPTLPDGNLLFDTANHSNLIATAPGVPSAPEATKVRIMMAKQTGIGTTRTIAVDPNVILTPISQLEAAETTYLTIRELVQRYGESKVATTDSNINVHRGGKIIVQEPELEAVSTTAWYAFDKRFRTIVHAFQTGYGRGGRRTTWYDPARGTRWIKLEGRFGAAAVGWRGSLKDPGA